MYFFSSATYEVTEDQLRTSLQTIFRVQLPKSGQTAPPEFLALPDLAESLKSDDDKNVLLVANKEDVVVQDHGEMISDILTEVIMKMANGGKRGKKLI